jgi:hypothetical protein
MDGPINFAHDDYVLNGASPNATYTVTLHISTASDATCSTPFVVAPVATLATNGSGNGEVDAIFPPELIGALAIHNSTVHVYFALSTGAGIAYTTAGRPRNSIGRGQSQTGASHSLHLPPSPPNQNRRHWGTAGFPAMR